MLHPRDRISHRESTVRELTIVVSVILTSYLTVESAHHVVQEYLEIPGQQTVEAPPRFCEEELASSISREELVRFSRQMGTTLGYQHQYPDEAEEVAAASAGNPAGNSCRRGLSSSCRTRPCHSSRIASGSVK